MAIRPVLTYPDPRLRLRADEVRVYDKNLESLAADMIETMYAEEGIGLAATQIGDNRRVLVLDVSNDRNEPQVFVNPVILAKEGSIQSEEGCLSVPGVRERVERAARIKVEARTAQGELFDLWAEALLAICLQHEIDHLDGRLFIDHLSLPKRERLRKRYFATHRSGASA